MISLQVMITIFVQILAFVYLQMKVPKTFSKKRQCLLWSSSILLTLVASYVIYETSEDICTFTRFITLYQILFCVAVIDYHYKIIPNFLLLVGMGCQFLCNLFTHFMQNSSWMQIFQSNIIGLLGSIFLLLLIYLLSKQSIGFGDVKLFGVLGFYTDFSFSFTILFLALLCSSLCAIVCLISKRKSRTDTIPFGPFVFLGFLLGLWIQK